MSEYEIPLTQNHDQFENELQVCMGWGQWFAAPRHRTPEWVTGACDRTTGVAGRCDRPQRLDSTAIVA